MTDKRLSTLCFRKLVGVMALDQCVEQPEIYLTLSVLFALKSTGSKGPVELDIIDSV